MDILKKLNIELVEKELERVKEGFKNGTIDYYDIDLTIYHYEEIIKSMKKNPNGYLMITKNNNFFDIVIKDNFHGIEILTPLFEIKESIEELNLLFSKYPNAIVRLCSYYSFDIKEEGFFICSLKSSFDNSKTYTAFSNSCFIVNKEENIFKLRDAYEEKFIGTPNLENLHYELLTTEQMAEKFSKRDEFFDFLWENDCGQFSTVGFHYFKHNEVFSSYAYDNNYLLAIDSNETIVGIIKYGTYSTGKNHLGLNYIDVRKDCRNKGVAKKLIKKFAEIVEKNLPLILSDESNMGHKCNMGKHFKEEIAKICPSMKVVFTSELYSYSDL